jgi:peptidyl-prolyl cis-trans isomerase B (cyclophilin B)
VSPASKVEDGDIGPLLPGELFVTRMKVVFKPELFEDGLPFYVQWYGSTGPMKGVRSNQLMLTPLNVTKPMATMTTSKGVIVMELWPEVAPNHVANFITLARDGFYNSRIFHRVIAGFMIQTGCPQGTGGGGPGYSIKEEFNDKDFKKGVLGMARGPSPNSAGSQFFICVDDKSHLNNQYTAFGRVIEGQGVADDISKVRTAPGDKPLEPITIESIEVTLPKGYTLPEVIKN